MLQRLLFEHGHIPMNQIRTEFGTIFVRRYRPLKYSPFPWASKPRLIVDFGRPDSVIRVDGKEYRGVHLHLFPKNGRWHASPRREPYCDPSTLMPESLRIALREMVEEIVNKEVAWSDMLSEQ
jgi:hypothetical protein